MISFPPEYQIKYLQLEKRKIELKINLLEIELSQVRVQKNLLIKLEENSLSEKPTLTTEHSPEKDYLSDDDLQILFRNLQKYIDFFEDQDRKLVKNLIGIQERLTSERILDLSPISENKELIRRILLGSRLNTN